MTLLAALLPALRAGRVPPIAAILGLSTPLPRAPGWSRWSCGAVCRGAVTRRRGRRRRRAEDGLRRLGLGALSPSWGWPCWPGTSCVPWSRSSAGPGRACSGCRAGSGCDHAVRNPQRTVMTSAALTVGLALVVLTSVFSASATASLGRALDEGQRADYLVSTPSSRRSPAEVTAALATRPEFATVAGLRTGSAPVAGGAADLFAGDPAAAGEVARPRHAAGSVAGLGQGGVLVHERRGRATAGRWATASTMTFARAGRQQVRVAGIFAEKRLLGTDYIIGLGRLRKWYSQPLDLGRARQAGRRRHGGPGRGRLRRRARRAPGARAADEGRGARGAGAAARTRSSPWSPGCSGWPW